MRSRWLLPILASIAAVVAALEFGLGGRDQGPRRPEFATADSPDRTAASANAALEASGTADEPPIEGRSAPASVPTVRPARAFTLLGRVVDPRGWPVADAHVELFGVREGAGQLVSICACRVDQAGGFEFNASSAGRPALRVRASGFLDHFEGFELPPEGKDVLEVVCHLDPGLSISGTALLLDGDPAAGARVWLEGKATQHSTRTRADAEGHFELRTLEPGSYTLRAEVQALPRADRLDFESLRRGRIHRYQGSLQVAAGARGVVLELLPDCSIAGRVVDAAGAPVPRFEVCFAPLSGPALEIERPLRWEAFENLKGEFEIDGLSRGTWSLLARTPEGSLSVPQSLVLGADVDGEELVVHRGHALVVQTVDASSQPVAGAHVVVQNSAPELARFELDQLDTQSDEEGWARFPAMLTGRVTVSVTPGSAGASEPAEYELPSLDEPTEIRLVLQRGAMVKPATW